MSAKVIALHIRAEKGDSPQPVSTATGIVGGGIEGDIHAHRRTRGIVMVDRSTHDALGLAPGDLREQITIDGLPDVTRLAPETEIRVGGVTLRVTGECEPCTHIGGVLGQPDHEAFQASLQGRRGATCTVSRADGPIRVGDPVEVLVRA